MDGKEQTSKYVAQQICNQEKMILFDLNRTRYHDHSLEWSGVHCPIYCTLGCEPSFQNVADWNALYETTKYSMQE
jgi:hypothetical protein